jgi:hypothetical protein
MTAVVKCFSGLLRRVEVAVENMRPRGNDLADGSRRHIEALLVHHTNIDAGKAASGCAWKAAVFVRAEHRQLASLGGAVAVERPAFWECVKQLPHHRVGNGSCPVNNGERQVAHRSLKAPMFNHAKDNGRHSKEQIRAMVLEGPDQGVNAAVTRYEQGAAGGQHIDQP